MDSDIVGQGLRDTMKGWEGILPYTTDPFLNKDAEKSKLLKDFVAKYDVPNTKGCLFSGAGGGFLMVISDEPIEGAMKITINHDFLTKPHPSDKLGAGC